MPFSTLYHLRGILCLIFIFTSVSIFAQFSVRTDQVNANYSLGETAEFTINSSQSGTATYKLKYDNITPVISTGSIDVQAGVPAIIPFQSTSAEVILCEVSLNGNSQTAAAAFNRDDIPLFSEEPTDFDQYWNTQKSISAAIPLDPQLSFHSSDGEVTTYRINLANVDDRRVYGYISIPNTGSNFPAIITLPPYSSAANTANPQEFIANRAKVISVSLSVHNAEPDQADPNAYEPDNINNRNEYYYRSTILGTLRMIDYLYTRADFDGQNIGLTGVSQGGGLSLIAAGLDNRVKSLTISNPALCRHNGYDENKASGFPYYLQRSEVLVNNATHYTQTKNASRYYEAAFFARRYTGPTLAIVSYADDVTPASASFAALNELRGKKVVAHARDLDHAHPTAYWDGRYDMWRHEFPTTINPPYYTSTGYSAEAGDDRAATVDEGLDLSGQIFQNGIVNNNFPVQWKMVEGAGNVTFSNANVKNPTVQFDAPGTYLLKFTALDYSGLFDEGIFHEISDFVSIEVAAGEIADVNSPLTQLVFSGFSTNGSLEITVNFNEPITGLTATDFQVINGTVESLTGNASNYYIQVLPTAVGEVRVNLPYGRVSDAAGNLNLPSNQITIYISNPPNNPSNNNLCNNVISGGEIDGDESDCEAFDPSPLGSIAFPTGGGGVLHYQWQSSPSLSGNWSNISNATAATFDPPTLTETTYFRRLARRSNCEEFTGISNAIVKEIIENETPVEPPTGPTGYCEMQGNNPEGVFIRKIELENLSHSSEKEGYGDFTAETANLAPGGVYMVVLTPGNTAVMNNWVGWIDYNQDGDFRDERELIIFKNDNNAVNAFFEVPPSASEGATRMRIALRGDGFAAPCYSYDTGEVEDYTVIIGDGAGGNTNNDEEEDDNNSPEPGTPPSYCTVRGTQPWWQWISRVQFSDLDHESFKDLYGDFTDRFATVEAGNAYELTLTPDFSWLIEDVNWKVWIDYNQDGDFEDAGEMIAAGTAETEVSFDVQIPNAAPSGTTGMRVAMHYGEISDACTDIERGEFEDYSVVITGASDCGQGNGRFRAILDLTAEPYEREVELYWTTNTEYKNSNFVLEHSTDGTNFTELETRPSVDNGYLPNFYLSKHEAPPIGENIYRVKQIYDSGSFKYSNERKVFFNIDLNAFTPYPNPTSQKLYLPLQKYEGQAARIKIYNTFAQLLSTSVVESISIDPEEIDVSDLPDGIYYISIEVAGQRTICQAFTVFRI